MVWYIYKVYKPILKHVSDPSNIVLDQQPLLSQPNNNQNPNNKTTITVVGLRQRNCWEHPPPTHPPPQTQNYMIEQIWSNILKTKVVSLYKKTSKQFLNPTPTPKIAYQGPKKSKMTQILSQNQKAELKELQKIKVVHLHKQSPFQFLSPTPTPKSPLEL